MCLNLLQEVNGIQTRLIRKLSSISCGFSVCVKLQVSCVPLEREPLFGGLGPRFIQGSCTASYLAVVDREFFILSTKKDQINLTRMLVILELCNQSRPMRLLDLREYQVPQIRLRISGVVKHAHGIPQIRIMMDTLIARDRCQWPHLLFPNG